MSVRFAILAAAGCMTSPIAASAPLIGEANGSPPAAELHAPVMGDLLADPTQSLAFKAVEFADPVVQLATRADDASLRDAAGQVQPVTGKVTDARPDPCPSPENAACATEPRKDRAETGAVGESASTAPQAAVGAALVALLCLGLTGCLVLGISPIFRALSTHKQRKHWRAIKSRLVEAARVH